MEEKEIKDISFGSWSEQLRLETVEVVDEDIHKILCMLHLKLKGIF